MDVRHEALNRLLLMVASFIGPFSKYDFISPGKTMADPLDSKVLLSIIIFPPEEIRTPLAR
jgi:hypothetical protein